LYKASKMAKKFFRDYRATRDPMEIFNAGDDYTGAPAYEIYYTGAEELAYYLKNNPVQIERFVSVNNNLPEAARAAATDHFARSVTTKISNASFESVRVAIERAVSAQQISLEKGMTILTTAVAGGPFLGLLGTVWGVMETFSGIAVQKAACLQAMAPGVAGALIATVAGLFVAIPAMFAYNYMVTTIRATTQEMDNYATEFATAIEHAYVDNRPVSEEIADALRKLQSEGKVAVPEGARAARAGAV
ncbi:MAG: MotA/TolQ/ExbB proton channel family protein, partial [Gammaproteobacteria bacterium]